MNINSDVFCKLMVTGIMSDIKRCQKVLGDVCIELADHRQSLNVILSSGSMEVLNEKEIILMKKFNNFIMMYTGDRGSTWTFHQSTKRGFRASQWLHVNGILNIDTQVDDIHCLERQVLGFQEQIADLAENLYIRTQRRCDIPHAGHLFVKKLKEYHTLREYDRQRRSEPLACGSHARHDSSLSSNSSGSDDNSRVSAHRDTDMNPEREIINLESNDNEQVNDNE